MSVQGCPTVGTVSCCRVFKALSSEKGKLRVIEGRKAHDPAEKFQAGLHGRQINTMAAIFFVKGEKTEAGENQKFSKSKKEEFMRTLKVLFATAVAVCGISAYSYAFTPVSRSSFTATVTFTASQGQVSMLAQLSSGTGITWNAAAITPGSTEWVAASNYITLHSTISRAGGGIQIYTDNRASDAPTVYTGAAGTNPAGLVASAAPAETPLRMCWRIMDGTTTWLGIVQGGDNNDLYSTQMGGVNSQFPCWFWMTDRNTPAIASSNTSAFVDGGNYVTLKTVKGIHYASDDPANGVVSVGATESPDIIYLGANFKQAVAPRTYNARIRLEAFTE